MNQDPIDVLWTGGYDSTFRLCELLIVQGRRVQPVYATHMGFQDEVILDCYDRPNEVQKPAMPHELQAIEQVRGALAETFPHAYARLLPLRFVPARTATADWPEAQRVPGPGINKGRQYDLLRMVAERWGRPLELCIERSMPGHNAVGDSLIPHVESVGGVFRLKPELPDELLRPGAATSLFNFTRFRFPLLHTTRGDMLEVAARDGYSHLLRMTWSCRDFRPDQRQCGVCFCCRGRIRDGVWWPAPFGR